MSVKGRGRDLNGPFFQCVATIGNGQQRRGGIKFLVGIALAVLSLGARGIGVGIARTSCLTTPMAA